MTAADKKVIVFDGICSLCINAVKRINRWDKKNQFVFLSFQSDEARQLMQSLPEQDFNPSPVTVYVLENHKWYVKSAAIFNIVRHLGWPWKGILVLNIFPRFINDYIYDYIANNRYHWFGKIDSCKINEHKSTIIIK